MGKRSLTLAERETIIRKADDEDCWSIYTCSPAMAKRVLRMAGRPGVSAEKVDAYGYRFTLPASCIRFVAPRALSDAEKEQRRRALARAKEAVGDVSR